MRKKEASGKERHISGSLNTDRVNPLHMSCPSTSPLSACLAVCRLAGWLVSQRVCKACPGRGRVALIIYVPYLPLLTLFQRLPPSLYLSHSLPISLCGIGRVVRQKAKMEEEKGAPTDGSPACFLQIVKNIIIYASLEEKNIIHYSTWCTKGNDNGVPRRVNPARLPGRKKGLGEER